MYNSDYWLNIRGVWTNWPNREIGGLLKWYILVQYAFWLQQIMVIQIEERRKDHWQMFAHHIITSTLLFTSYGYHQTKVGNVILCLMDVVDLFLPVSFTYNHNGFVYTNLFFQVGQVSKVHEHKTLAGYSLWLIYGHLVLCKTCSIFDGLLLCVGSYSRGDIIRLLSRKRGKLDRPIPTDRQFQASHCTFPQSRGYYMLEQQDQVGIPYCATISTVHNHLMVLDDPECGCESIAGRRS
jgi:hypothetical protein